MILHVGERVFWGAPEVIYLEGSIVSLDAAEQIVTVHVERTTPYSAHLIASNIPFAADGVTPIQGESPPGTTDQYNAERLPPPQLSDEEKIRRTAATAIHQVYGYELAAEQESYLIEQIANQLEQDPARKAQIITTMDEILKREW
jgi:alpha-acetolactate decarboxylase